jgi:hypothetical protein
MTSSIQTVQYPNGLDSTYTQNFINTAKHLASSNRTYTTTEDALIRSDLSNYEQVFKITYQTLTDYMKEEDNNEWFPLVFPITEALKKTETSTLVHMNKFHAIPTSRVGQKFFTTEWNETFINTKELVGSGFQVSTDFQDTELGKALYYRWVYALGDSLKVALKMKLYSDGILAISCPFNDYMLRLHGDNLEKYIDIMDDKKKDTFNMINKRLRCIEHIQETMGREQKMIGQKKPDVLITHPGFDVIRKLEENYRNDIKGQYDKIDGPQNKPHADERMVKVGSSTVVYQEPIEIATGVFYSPLENIVCAGETYLMPNAIHNYPELHNEQKRSIKIWDEAVSMNEYISYTEAVVKTAELYNSIANDQTLTFANTFGSPNNDLTIENVIDGVGNIEKDKVREFCNKRFTIFVSGNIGGDFEKSIIAKYTISKVATTDDNYDLFNNALNSPYTSTENMGVASTGIGFAHIFCITYTKISLFIKTKFGITDIPTCLDLYKKCLENEGTREIVKTGQPNIRILDTSQNVIHTSNEKTKGLNYFEKMCYYIFMGLKIGKNNKLDVDAIRLLARNGIEVGWNVLVVRRQMVYRTANICGVLSGGGTFKRGVSKVTPKMVTDEENDEYRIGVTQYQQALKVEPKSLYWVLNALILECLSGGSTKWANSFKEISDTKANDATIKSRTYDIYGMFVPMDSKYNHRIIHTSHDDIFHRYQLSKLFKATGLFGIYKHIVPNQNSKDDFIDHFRNNDIKPNEYSSDDILRKKLFANSITNPGPYLKRDIHDEEEVFTGNGYWEFTANKDAKKRFLSKNF